MKSIRLKIARLTKFIEKHSPGGERGASMIVVAIMVSVMIAGLILSTSTYFDRTLRTITANRDRIAGLQALQDFALLAQRANEAYINNGNTCAVGGYTPLPAGKPFCWHTGGATENCIRNPIYSGGTLCLQNPGAGVPPTTSATSNMWVASMDVAPPPSRFGDLIAEVKDAYTFRHELVAQVEHDVLRAADGTAHAAFPTGELFYPDDAGAPTGNIFRVNCGNTVIGAGNEYCKHCQPTVAVPNGVPCVELRVCLSSRGCNDFTTSPYQDWYRQRIAVLPRQ